MLEQMRTTSGNLITYVLFSMIIIVFIFTFGAVDPSEACRGGGVSKIATVDEAPVTDTDFRMAGGMVPDYPGPRAKSNRAGSDRLVYLRFRYPYSPLRGRFVNAAATCNFGDLDCADFGMRPGNVSFVLNPRELPVPKPQKILEHLQETILVSNAATKLGLIVGNDELKDRVRPQFVDPKTQTFDKAKWVNQTRRSGGSSAQYEGFLKKELQREKMLALTLHGLTVSDYELGFYHRLASEKVGIEYVAIDATLAEALVAVSDAEVTAWLGDEANTKKATDRYTKQIKDYTEPTRYDVRIASINATHGQAAIDAEKDAAKKATMVAARTAAKASADKLAALDLSAGSAGLTEKAISSDQATATYGDAVAKALATLKAGGPGQVVATDDAFVALHLVNVIAGSVSPFKSVQSAVAKGMLTEEKAVGFKKDLADELLTALKADGAKSLTDHANALNAKYGAKKGLTVAESGLFARVFQSTDVYPFTTSLDKGQSLANLGRVGSAGKSLPLLKAAFAAKKDAALLGEVYTMAVSGNLVVAKVNGREAAGDLGDDVDDLRGRLHSDKEQLTYLSWYGELRTKKPAQLEPLYEQLVNQEVKTWIDGGGTVPGATLAASSAQE